MKQYVKWINEPKSKTNTTLLKLAASVVMDGSDEEVDALLEPMSVKQIRRLCKHLKSLCVSRVDGDYRQIPIAEAKGGGKGRQGYLDWISERREHNEFYNEEEE